MANWALRHLGLADRSERLLKWDNIRSSVSTMYWFRVHVWCSIEWGATVITFGSARQVIGDGNRTFSHRAAGPVPGFRLRHPTHALHTQALLRQCIKRSVDYTSDYKQSASAVPTVQASGQRTA